MRVLQITFFCVGAAAFLAAIFFIGSDTGNTLWRVGVAMLLIDVVCLLLWPGSKAASETMRS